MSLVDVFQREPDFVIGEFKFYVHPLVPDNMIYALFGKNILVSKGGNWREFNREQLESRLREVLKL